METRIAGAAVEEVIGLRDGSRFDMWRTWRWIWKAVRYALWWSQAAGVSLAFWAGRRTAISPGAPCAALARTLS